MACGIAHSGRRVYEPPKLEHLGSGFCTQGPRMMAHMVPRMTARRDLEWQRAESRMTLSSVCTAVRNVFQIHIQEYIVQLCKRVNPPTFSSMENCLDYDRLALSHLNTKVFIFTSFFSEI